MRYGILSDVHGNIEALEVVLAHLREQQVDRVAFLGDAVGYGANPNEACDMIRAHASASLLGNHDAAVSGRMDYSDYYPAARQALDWCSSQVSEANHAWLAQLPYKVATEHMEFSHGSPIEPQRFDYLFSPDQVNRVLRRYDELADVSFIGHSHLTLSFRLEPGRVVPLTMPEIVCEPPAKYIITVGSVGQPRDRDPRSCVGIYDSATRVFEYHRLEYDCCTTRRKIIEAGLAPAFGERLLMGM